MVSDLKEIKMEMKSEVDKEVTKRLLRVTENIQEY